MMASTSRTFAVGLGWAGVLPFAALSLVAVFAPGGIAAEALRLLVGYGAIILGFLGGVQWGLEMGRPDQAPPARYPYGVSVIPSLIGFAAMLAPPAAGLWVLMGGFSGLLAYERWRDGKGAPGWYASLRWQLSSAVIAALLMAALAGAGTG